MTKGINNYLDDKIVDFIKKKQTYKPDSVISELVSESKTNQKYLIIYLDQQLLIDSSFLPFGNGRVILKCRYTWNFTAQSLPGFTTALSVHTFCCTCPPTIARCDGCYPLCYSLVSGLSFTPKRDDKAVCEAKIGI